LAIKWKSISAHVGTQLIRVAVVTAILGAVLIGMGIMVGENFALVFDQVEYVGSARAKHLLNRGHSFAWELFTSYPDPERQRMAEFNLSDPVPFFYYVREGDSPAMTNIGAVDDVQALFQALPLFYRSEGAKTDLIIYVGVPETVFAAEAAQYILDRGRVSAAFVSIIVGLLVLALGASGVAYAAWRPALHTMAQPRWWDKMPLELCVGVIVWLSLYSAEMMPGLRFAFQREGTVGWLAAGVLLIVALAMLGLCYVYLASRHLRGRTFIQHTFIGAVVLGVIKLLQVDPVSWRGVLFTCFAAASTFLTLLLMETAFSQAVGALVVFAVFLALHGATLVYVLRRAKDIKRIATGAEAIR